jgi:hypothetical protein
MATANTFDGLNIEPAPTNRIGLAGFVVSLLGILTLGILSPIAFVVSLVGLRKSPRGFAIAGSVLGLLGTVLLVGIGYAGFVLGKFALSALPEIAVAVVQSTVAPLMGAADVISAEAAKRGVLPDEVEGNRLIAAYHDYAGHPLRYQTDGKSFSVTTQVKGIAVATRDDLRIAVNGADRRIVTAGQDGKFDTADDEKSESIPMAPPAAAAPKK